MKFYRVHYHVGTDPRVHMHLTIAQTEAEAIEKTEAFITKEDFEILHAIGFKMRDKRQYIGNRAVQDLLTPEDLEIFYSLCPGIYDGYLSGFKKPATRTTSRTAKARGNGIPLFSPPERR